MKSPRELLLARHEAAARKLEPLRKKLVNQAVRECRDFSKRSSQADSARSKTPKSVGELIALLGRWAQSLQLSRLNAASLTMIWLVILILKLATPAPTGSPQRMASHPTEAQRMAMLERRRLLIELTGSSGEAVPSPPNNPAPRPRTERTSRTAAT